MVLAAGPVHLPSEMGLYALWALVPFVLLYLIRSRPKQLMIPSIMFFFKQSALSRLTSFFKHFIRDWLFLIQLLALLLFIFALFQPFFFYDHDITAQNTVIVIDVSASSRVVEGSRSRLEIAQEKATTLLGSKNTVILAKDTPLIGVQDASASEAEDYIERLTSRDTGSEIGNAILLAGEVLAGKEGRIIVLSDFINTRGQKPDVAKAVVESQGTTVDVVSTATGEKANAGIIDLVVKDDVTVVHVKNFGREPTTGTLSGRSVSKELTLAAGATAPFAFKTPPGTTKFTLSPNDAFPTDNVAYVRGQSDEKVRVLLLTNNRSVFLQAALMAIPFIDLTTAQPPIVPKDRFDIYVFHGIDPREVLPGTFEDILAAVKEGSLAIIHAFDTLHDVDYRGLFPYQLWGYVQQGVVEVQQTTKITRDRDFGTVARSYNVTPTPTSPATTVLASVNGVPLLATSRLGKGSVFYYGILESASDFKFSPSYPLFWHSLMQSFTEREDLSSVNVKTDHHLVFDSVETVTTPQGIVRQATLLPEYVGEYVIGKRKIVANLLNEREGHINPGTQVGESASSYQLRPVKEQREYRLETAILIAGLIALLFELLFVKLRGDL